MLKKILKKYILKFKNKNKPYYKLDIRLKHSHFGNDYGGFPVYSDHLNHESIIYSFGIGEDISFDLAVIEKYKCKVFGYDPTPKSIKWVNSINKPNQFIFTPIGISDKNGQEVFYLPKIKEYVSGSSILQNNVDNDDRIVVEMKCLKTIADINKHTQIDILKMDIEGAEYKVINDILNSGIEIKQILIEFHDRFVENGAEKTGQTIEKLRQNGFLLFAVSDSYEELSFINKNSIF